MLRLNLEPGLQMDPLGYGVRHVMLVISFQQQQNGTIHPEAPCSNHAIYAFVGIKSKL